MRQTASAFAPGSIGNVGPGLDILGLAVAGRGDTVTLTLGDGGGIVVADPGHRELPTNPRRHTAAIAAQAVFATIGFTSGVSLRLQKGLPLSGGQGGSAASAVAGAVAADHLCDARLDAATLLQCALTAEDAVAGRHADNLAPSLLGGLVLVALPLKMADARALSNFGGPVMLAAGTGDTYCPAPQLEALHKQLGAHAQLRMVEGADHFFGGFEVELADAIESMLANF